MVAKTPAAGKAAPATKPKKALVASSPVEPGEQLPEGASASDAGVPGTPGTSSAGDASGMVAPQGETSPDLGAGDGEMHHSERDKAPVASSPVEPGEQIPEGSSASTAGVPGAPGTSSAGEAPGEVAPQGEASPNLGAGDGEMHHSKRDKAEAAGPTTPPEPTWEFRASSAIEHDGSRIEPGAPLTLTREQFEALKAVGAVDGAWPEVSS